MTKERADRIVANPDNYTSDAVSKAKEFLQNKVNKVTMTEERARKILANPKNYTQDAVDKANDVIAIKNAGMSAPGADWVRKYMPVNTNGGFNFNWRQALDTDVKNDTEGLKKLEDYRKGKMWDVDDDVNLDNIATEMHFKQANEKWDKFVNSDRFTEFQNFLKDVQKYQTEKAVEDIWSGKEDKTLYDKFGTAAVNFMLPVSKEYAKNHYNDEDFSLTGPLMADIAANLVMLGPGAAEVLPAKVSVPVAKVMNRPLISTIYGNVAAPAITETGNVIYNDESIPEALARTAEGTAINIGTPRILEGVLSSAGRGLPVGESRYVQKMIDEATNKANKTQRDIQQGKPYAVGNNLFLRKDKNDVMTMYTPDDIHVSYSPLTKFASIKDLPSEAVTYDEYLQMFHNMPFSRGRLGNSFTADIIKEAQKLNEEELNQLLIKKAESLAKDGDLRNLTPVELRQLGFADKESFMNYLIRNIKMNMPSTLSTYLTNAAGRPEFGRRAGPIRNINYLLGTNLFDKDNSEEGKKSRLEKAYGF